MTQNEVLLVVAGPVAVAGLALPWFGHAHAGVLFGVSVPGNFETSREADRSIARYRRDSILWALFLLAVIYTCVRFGGDTLWLMLALSATGLPLELTGCFYLWHREHVHIATARGKLAELAATEGLELPPGRKDDLPTPDRPIAPLLIAATAFLPLMAASIILESHYPTIPEHFPQHWNASGIADGWGERTPATVFLPPLIGSAAVLLVVAATVLVGLASGSGSRHRMRTLAPLAALAWMLSLIFAVASLLPLHNDLSISHLGSIVVGMILVSVAMVLWLLIRTAPGLPGAQPLHRSTSSTSWSHWHAGVFYANPADPALLVPKRFGWGWTFNFARPAAWICMLVILALATAMLWLPRVITHIAK
ncbi:Protein of unknown function [Bryocella elongata]|uniref:DUF1648 domain-containing protein n=1 Tax=Bryocella elongata TaxID=863522 RepID=A0A1H6BH97_9BACT|nr:DUF5808 domain-containing protein [Bryocella elongata]SEG60004.1 Protein of unknown function [Bryocella elongata]